ncbi:MAG: long-chain fatty acid transport protein [Desulforhopalus sp.]|jgi:long-chain fatty acid transport protein
MKKKISVLALASILVAGSAMASGWRIPEQSVDSTAKAGANIASASRADAAYYNPANMSWMDDTWHVQANATYLYLSPIEYEDSRSSYYDDESESENFFIPTAFMVSPDFGGARVGLAITAPAGLSKQWEGYGGVTAGEFSMEVIEVNPSVSYAFGDMVSVAGGVRMLYADATVESDAAYVGVPASRYMNGDTVEWGWNLALAVKPMEKMNISATYRSEVDLDFKEETDLGLGGYAFTPTASVEIPVAAVFALSVAYDILDNLNVELTWDRTFWSAYEELDFNYEETIPGNPFEAAVSRDWDDTDAFRLGVTYGLSETIDLMVGFGYDNNPIPDESVDFSIPDSDAWLYSIGTQWAVNEKMDLGIAMLYDYKETRKVEVTPTGSVYGEFTDASAFLVTVGLNYKF